MNINILIDLFFFLCKIHIYYMIVTLFLFHSQRGSCINVSKTLIKDSLFSRRTLNDSSQHLRNTPSILVTPKASTILCVNLKGTFSGLSKVKPFLFYSYKYILRIIIYNNY